MLVVHAHWRRGRLLLGALSYPACWVTVEFLMARASPHGTFGNLAYTQVELLPLLQSVALAGPWALSFVVCALAAGLGGWFVPRVSLVRRAAVCGMTLALLGGAWAYGTWRLSANSATPASLRVALIAADQPPYPLPMDDARAQGAVDAYLAAIEQRGLEGARAVVLPETIVRADATQWPALSQRFADYARRLNLTIVVGIDLIEAEHERNVAAVFMPGGDAPLLHAKRHLVPMFEDRYTPGAATTVFDGLGGMWGAAVCKDLDFTTLGRDYGAASIAVLFVPAWDFGRDGWLHARMAMMRGVEQGYAVARAARRGLLTLSDNRGRVLVEVDSASAAVASALSELPVAAERTPYARIGDAFAWLCVAFALVSGLAMRRTGGAMR
jgi:apolipoprotein N-acyltransferase